MTFELGKFNVSRDAFGAPSRSPQSWPNWLLAVWERGHEHSPPTPHCDVCRARAPDGARVHRRAPQPRPDLPCPRLDCASVGDEFGLAYALKKHRLLMRAVHETWREMAAKKEA